MNPPHPSHLHHHHRLHLHLDPRHHHHIHIHLFHHGAHLLAATATAAAPPPTSTTGRRFPTCSSTPPTPTRPPTAATWQPGEPLHAGGPVGMQGEVATDLEERARQVEEAEEVILDEEEEGEPVFVLTDEWAEFFAKSEAKRRLAKQQKKNKCRKK